MEIAIKASKLFKECLKTVDNAKIAIQTSEELGVKMQPITGCNHVMKQGQATVQHQ
jgi:hypothetical protein